MSKKTGMNDDMFKKIIKKKVKRKKERKKERRLALMKRWVYAHQRPKIL